MLAKWKHADVDEKGENNINAKYKEKGKPASNHKPITCLPLVWELLTVATAEEI